MTGYSVFFDTEFTNWSTPRLISIGLVDLSGNRSFYAELTDTYTAGQYSAFVRAKVLPLLSGGEAQMTTRQCRQALAQWIEAFDAPVQLVGDHLEYDFYLVRELLGHAWPENLEPAGVQFEPKDHPDIQQSLIAARMRYYTELPGQNEHHALHDAYALRASWMQALSHGSDPGAPRHGPYV